MPSQCLPRTFSSRLANTSSSRSTCPRVSSRWIRTRRAAPASSRPSPSSAAPCQLFLGVVGVAQFVEKRVVQCLRFSHGRLSFGWCMMQRADVSQRAADRFRARSADAWRCAPMNASDAVPSSDRRRPGPGSALPDGSVCGMPAFCEQLRPRRRAPSIGLQWRYWSLTNSSARPSVAQALDRLGAVGQHDRVEQHRRASPRRHVDLDRLRPSAGSTGPASRPTKRGTAPSAASRSASATSGVAVDAVGDEDRDAPRPDAAVAGSREQRQRRRRRHLRRDVVLQHLRHRRGHLAHAETRRDRLRPAPARRSSGPTPSARGPPASAPATARSGTR